MTDLPSDFRLASALFTGMDILARAQYISGLAGHPANSALRLVSKGSQLKYIEQTAKELSPKINPLWWSGEDTGFYRPAYKAVMSKLSGDDVSADEIMAEAMSSEKRPPFWGAGVKASAGPLAEKILDGSLPPKDAVGLPVNYALKDMLSYIRVRKNRRRIEEEQSALVMDSIHPGAVGGFDQDEWEMVVEGIFDNANDPISKSFFSWLKAKVRGADSGAARTMDGFLDLAMTGQYKNEAEIARAMGMPNQAYLNKIVKEFTPMIAGWLAKGKGDVAAIRDLLSDRAFLMKLLKGKGDVPYKYAKLLRKASLIEAAKRASQSRLLSANDYVGMLTTAKFPAGKSMTVDEVAEVVGPEFKEMNENPPESVKKVMEGMKQASRILLSTDAFAEMLRDSKFEKGKPADPTENMSAEDAAEWERQTEANKDKFKTAAAAGLYGFTKSAEKSCTGATGKLAKYAAKLAKELYTKDADAAPFLEEHAKRGFKTAKIIRNAMSDVGPGPAPKTAASKSGNGLYGFKDKTAKLAMEACSDLHQAAGHLAADLAMKFGEKQEDGASFLKKHAKAAKCAFSDLILDSYPSAPVKVSEEKPAPAKPAPAKAEKKAPAKKASYPTVEEILAWDTRKATSFMASAEDDLMAEDLISEWDAELMAGRTWDGDKSTPDDATPYNKHPESPPAGADGSPQRANYNRWFRENVCPDHATGCGIPSLQG